MATWEEFIPTVDVPPPDAVSSDLVTMWFLELGFRTPGNLAGTQLMDLIAAEGYPAALPARALIARCLAAADAAAAERRSIGSGLIRPTAPPQTAAQDTLRDQIASVMGPVCDSAILAQALTEPQPDVGTLLAASARRAWPRTCWLIRRSGW